MSGYTYRVHPAIGIVRVGNSEEYLIGPESMAGLPSGGDGRVTGGLPIRPRTEADTINNLDLRDESGALKRQAARFRIYQYPRTKGESYPSGGGTEVQVGSSVDGKTVADIVWSVHVANKKANSYQLSEELGIRAYIGGSRPEIRNKVFGPDLDDPSRVRKLTIDPGPRTIRGRGAAAVRFDKGTVASYWDPISREVQVLPDYPKSFPDDSFQPLYCPSGSGITSLGELLTDDKGRLLVLGGYGRACNFDQPGGEPYPLCDDVNNDGWFDDVADGPVGATLVFDDGSTHEVEGVAWAVSADPSYAPQIPNVVSLWDDLLDTWIRSKLELCPHIYSGSFVEAFQPSFEDHLRPIFRSAVLQQWTTNLPESAVRPHTQVGDINSKTIPKHTRLIPIGDVFRDPDHPDQYGVNADRPLMPLSLGDAGQSFLTLTRTQLFFLGQWANQTIDQGPGPMLGPGEFLDKAVLVNCLGGRFNPGIELTFVVRDPDLYVQDWRNSGTGPFRINPRPLDYRRAQPETPFLSAGYVPLHTTGGIEPGDISKFMAIPWHTDYNSCATHLPDPNPEGNKILFWSWPAQRPVAVRVFNPDNPGKPDLKFSVRGEGTYTDCTAEVGRYQCRADMLKHWQDIGIVIQASAIDDPRITDLEAYLEVESRLPPARGEENQVYFWPNFDNSGGKKCPGASPE